MCSGFLLAVIDDEADSLFVALVDNRKCSFETDNQIFLIRSLCLSKTPHRSPVLVNTIVSRLRTTALRVEEGCSVRRSR